ncbi:hypothetical protein [Pseudomonas sp. BNK-43-a]|uniref:hypothetical protein n=1 Tax=unclassified Pseudomonas TaxID=196821 RepID=UPI0039BFFA7D
MSLILGIFALCQPLIWVGGEESVPIYAAEFFVVMGFIILSAMWVDRTLTPYVFLLATTIMFVGGRFIAYPIIGHEVFSDPNFVPIQLSDGEASRLMSKVLGGSLMVHTGYCFIRWADSKGSLWLPTHRPAPDFTLPALVLLLLSSAISIYGIIQHYAACSQLGYMSIYQDQQSDNLTRFASIGQYGLLLGTGLAFATPRKWLQALSMMLIVSYFMAYLGLGLRSGFLALMLMGTWVVHTRFKRLNIFTVMLVPVLMVALAQLSITVGCRAQSIAVADNAAVQKQPSVDAANVPAIVPDSVPIAIEPPITAQVEALENPVVSSEVADQGARSLNEILQQFRQRLRLDDLAWFAYYQGSTLIYSGAAMRLEHYPATAYFQSLIPGFSQVYGRLHADIPVSDYYFPHYLAKSYSEEKYDQGFGIGWSLYSDFQVFSGGNPIAYGLVALLFGLLLGYFLRAADSSAFVLGALICVFLKLMLLPRSGIYSIVPYVVAYSILYWTIRFGYRITPVSLKRMICWR